LLRLPRRSPEKISQCLRRGDAHAVQSAAQLFREFQSVGLGSAEDFGASRAQIRSA
jgi:hypothetical protein